MVEKLDHKLDSAWRGTKINVFRGKSEIECKNECLTTEDCAGVEYKAVSLKCSMLCNSVDGRYMRISHKAGKKGIFRKECVDPATQDQDQDQDQIQTIVGQGQIQSALGQVAATANNWM